MNNNENISIGCHCVNFFTIGTNGKLIAINTIGTNRKLMVNYIIGTIEIKSKLDPLINKIHRVAHVSDAIHRFI